MPIYYLQIAAFAGIKTILSLSYAIIVIVTIGVIIHEKRDPIVALAWITVIALVPVLGLILYMLFGRNHRKEKMFSRKEIDDLKQLEDMSRVQLEAIKRLNHSSMHHPDILKNMGIITLLLNNNKALLTPKNRVEILNNGTQKFPALIKALESAQSSIHIEYYIFLDDEIGNQIGDIMMRKASEGVEVRLIYDDVGSWGLSRKFVRDLKESGVHVSCFMPVAFPYFTSRVNYRNHRKIVVVDGLIGFTGGLNIADRYVGKGKLGLWRDTHLKIEGDAVKMLQALFATDWYFLNDGELLPDIEKYFPEPKVKGSTPVQIASSGPDSNWASIMQAFFAAITRARHHIYISSPYFLPNQAILTALKVAALSGIDVRIMLPSRSDTKIVYWATRSYIGELIEAGIKVYFYRRGFNHSKLIMIDSSFSSVGSANMDIRSFEDNFEVSAIIYDREIAVELESEFLKDLEDSMEITTQMWSRRSEVHSIYESFARLFSPLL